MARHVQASPRARRELASSSARSSAAALGVVAPGLIGLWVLAVACASAGVYAIEHGPGRSNGAVEQDLVYAPSAADNPLRGLVPYATADARERFPHSLEFDYFPLSALMVGAREFRWDALEASLEASRARGCQMVLRVFVEYPGRPTGIPSFLLTDGLAVTRWESADNGGGESVTPDYADPRLCAALRGFIAALGARYDGDPRVGYVTAGLLGSWGEWHTYPRADLAPPPATQREVLDAFEAAFTRTPILLRYPAGEGDEAYAPNAGRCFGYHDDSFGWATLDTGRREDSWYFVPTLRAAGALETWRAHPIGGEIRPELWATSFTGRRIEGAQDFRACVAATHATWLLDSGLFSAEFALDSARRERALEEVARMGYALHVSRARADREARTLTLTVENRGVAPFYATWPVELAAFRDALQVGVIEPDGWSLSAVAPAAKSGGRPPKVAWTVALDATWAGAELRVRVPNPMPGGRPLRFANREQQGEWLALPVTL